jgi:regulatory protein
MNSPKTAKIYDTHAAYAKAENYCAYQERSQQEVRDKLYEWGLKTADAEAAIAKLVENNFVNEERFAIAYATGKFNQKGWGRIKIKQGLKLKRVPDVLVKKALQRINPEVYYQTLVKTIEKKAALLNEKNQFSRRNKLQQFALSRGFESDLISEVLNEM